MQIQDLDKLRDDDIKNYNTDELMQILNYTLQQPHPYSQQVEVILSSKQAQHISIDQKQAQTLFSYINLFKEYANKIKRASFIMKNYIIVKYQQEKLQNIQLLSQEIQRLQVSHQKIQKENDELQAILSNKNQLGQIKTQNNGIKPEHNEIKPEENNDDDKKKRSKRVAYNMEDISEYQSQKNKIVMQQDQFQLFMQNSNKLNSQNSINLYNANNSNLYNGNNSNLYNGNNSNLYNGNNSNLYNGNNSNLYNGNNSNLYNGNNYNSYNSNNSNNYNNQDLNNSNNQNDWNIVSQKQIEMQLSQKNSTIEQLVEQNQKLILEVSSLRRQLTNQFIQTNSNYCMTECNNYNPISSSRQNSNHNSKNSQEQEIEVVQKRDDILIEDNEKLQIEQLSSKKQMALQLIQSSSITDLNETQAQTNSFYNSKFGQEIVLPPEEQDDIVKRVRKGKRIKEVEWYSERQFLSNLREWIKIALYCFCDLMLTILLQPSFVVIGISRMLKYLYRLLTGENENGSWKDFVSGLSQAFFSVICIYIVYKSCDSFINQTEYAYKWIFFTPLLVYFVQILLFSFIKNVKHQYLQKSSFLQDTLSNCYNNDTEILGMQYDLTNSDLVFDITTESTLWNLETLKQLNALLVGIDVSSKYDYFVQKEQKTDQTVQSLISNNFDASFYSFSSQAVYHCLFQFVVAIKLFMIIEYFRAHDIELNQSLLNYSIVALFYIKINFNFTHILGNYDLRRKKTLINLINQMIKMESENSLDFSQKIDILSSQSLNLWNASRKIVYTLFLEQQTHLEICYIFFLAYYLFTLVVCISALFNFSVFFQQDSILTSPIMIIQSFTDFIMMSILIIARVYECSSLNDTFETTSTLIMRLITCTQEILNAFDTHYQQLKYGLPSYQTLQNNMLDRSKQNQLRIIVRNNLAQENIVVISFNDILMQKIRYLSYQIVENNQFFDGQIQRQANSDYEHKQLLYKIQKTYLNTVSQQLQQIYQDIQLDKQLYQYKIFNLVAIDFKSLISSLAVAFVPFVGTIFNTFFDIYTK